MIQRLGLDVETWALAADTDGFWLLSGRQPCRTGEPLTAYEDPHTTAIEIIRRCGLTQAGPVRLLHKTSDRYQPPRSLPTPWPARHILTYVAVLPAGTNEPGSVRLTWPAAQPVDVPALLDVVGKPSSWTGPTSPPAREIDVLHHAVRHLAFLYLTDDPIRQVLDNVSPAWGEHLTTITPELANLYRAS